MRFGVFQLLCLRSRIDELTAAISRIIFPLQIALCFQIGSLLGHSAFICPQDLAYFRLRDAGPLPHDMNEIKFRSTDSFFLHRPGSELSYFPAILVI